MMAATNSAKPSKTISVDRVRRMSGCKRIMQNPHTPLHIMCAIAIAIAGHDDATSRKIACHAITSFC